jgi:hypothetical protein
MDSADKERLIRLEERVKSILNDLKRIARKLDRVAEDIQEAEMLARKNSLTVSMGEKVIWLVASGGIGVLLWFLERSV